jgi:hypothetical protein
LAALAGVEVHGAAAQPVRVDFNREKSFFT